MWFLKLCIFKLKFNKKFIKNLMVILKIIYRCKEIGVKKGNIFDFLFEKIVLI